MRRLWTLLALSGLLVLVGGCGAAPDSSQQAASANTVPGAPTTVPPVASSPAAGASDVPTATPTDEPQPTVEPNPTPTEYGLGQPISVNGDNDEPALVISVSRFSQHASYGSGYLVSHPDPSNVYIQVWVEYRALQDGATYNPLDWQVYVDDTAQSNFSFILSEPKPALSSGSLAAGRKAAGWLTYEVPSKGRVVLSYGSPFGGSGPLFDVVVRPG